MMMVRVDLKRTLDRVKRELLWQVLKRYCVRRKSQIAKSIDHYIVLLPSSPFTYIPVVQAFSLTSGCSWPHI